MAQQETVFNQGLNPLGLDLFQIIGVGGSVLWRLRQNFSIWFSGTGAPTTQVGQLNGNLYLNTSNGAIYQLQSGSWVQISATGGNPGGSNTQVQYNDGGFFAGDSTFTFNNSTKILTASTQINTPILHGVAAVAITAVSTVNITGATGVNVTATTGNAAITASAADVTLLSTLGNVFVTANTGVAFNTTNGQDISIQTFTGLSYVTTQSGRIVTWYRGSGTSANHFIYNLDTGELRADIHQVNDHVQFCIGNDITMPASRVYSPANGVLELTPTAGPGNAFTRLQFGGTTSGFPAIGISGLTLIAQLADGSADTVFRASTLIESATHTPSSAADTGIAGQIAWDASFVYICTAANTWKRVAIVTW